MNIRDLEYIIAVAELRNFSKAADYCHISQPTLSNQIKKLEEQLGVSLFERSNKKVIPTPAGIEIVAIARDIICKIEDIRELAEAAQKPLSGKFRLGAFPTLAPYIFPKIVQPIIKKMPELQLILIEEKTAYLIDSLKSGKLDAALLALPINDEQLLAKKLFADEFLIATPPNHPLISQREITQSTLTQYRLLLLNEGHCLRDQALEICQMIGSHEDQDFRATSLETLRQMVKSGVGITLMPQIAISAAESGITYIPFSNPKPKRTIAIVCRKTFPKKQLLDTIIPIIASAGNTIH